MNIAHKHVAAPEQGVLFDDLRLGSGPAIPTKITPGCFLPVQHNEMIDVERAMNILKINQSKYLLRFIKEGHLRGFRNRDVRSSPWRVEYSSIVEFCEQLRERYHLHHRKPEMKGKRLRDADLLPFPWHDTMTVTQAMVALDTTRVTIIRMCEEGRFDCYRLLPRMGVPWRISKSSLFQYAQSRSRQQKPRPALRGQL